MSSLDGRMLYLRVASDRERNTVLDSCQVVHGRFSFGGSMDSCVMAQLFLGNTSIMPVVLENGELLVELDNVGNIVKGGPLNDRLYKFLQKRDSYEGEIWELEQESLRMLREGKTLLNVRERLTPEAQNISRKIEKLETKFVISNFDNPLGLGYFMIICDREPLPTITEQMQEIIDAAPESFFNNLFVKHYLTMAAMRQGIDPCILPEESQTQGFTRQSRKTKTPRGRCKKE